MARTIYRVSRTPWYHDIKECKTIHSALRYAEELLRNKKGSINIDKFQRAETHESE